MQRGECIRRTRSLGALLQETSARVLFDRQRETSLYRLHSSRKEPVARTSDQPEDAEFLTARGREAIVNDIVREMRKDSLKESVRANLNRASGWRVVGKSLQHPAALLVLGFALTAGGPL